MGRQVAIAEARTEARALAAAPANHRRICVVHTAAVADSVGKLAAILSAERYSVVPLGLGRSVVADIVAADPDLVIVLVSGSRFHVGRLCEGVHDAIDARIMIVAEPGNSVTEASIIDLLDAGADDFIVAATATPVLLARIRVALRDSPPRRRASRRIVVGAVLIDLEAHVVLMDGEPVNCPPRQFDMLVALASNAGTLVLRDTLINEVWGVPPVSVDPRRVRIAVSLLRRLIGTGPGRPRIESVSRIGYRLVVTPT
jgi:DNA-binding response OmpR family regulator